jgi:hypothetical protein
MTLRAHQCPQKHPQRRNPEGITENIMEKILDMANQNV